MGGKTGALLLDFDGTLADSLGAMRDAYRAFARNRGFAPSGEEFDRLNGPPLAEVVDRLCAWHGIADRQAALYAYEAEIETAVAGIRPSHGAGNLLQAARAAGWRTGIVTSNDRRRVENWLASVGLGAMVDVVIGGDVRPGKPDPAPYLAALDHLGCAPGEALAVEDSVQGAGAALAAGVRTIFYRPLDRAEAPAGTEPVESLSAILPLLTGEERRVRIRLATEADRPFLYALRNDPAAARNSRTARALSDAELAERFAPDPSLTGKITVIAEVPGGRAGMVRFDAGADGYVVSIVIAEQFRGRGVGSLCLQAAIDAVLAMRGPAALGAEVAVDNAASTRLFERCGFAAQGQVGRFRHFLLPARPC